jgi:NADH-quinone oxidoreductase subunit L
VIPSWLPVVVWVLPLLVALVVAVLPRRAAGLAHGLAAASLGVGLLLAIWQACAVLGEGQVFSGPHTTWLDLGTFTLGVGVHVDAMAAIMTGIVYLLGTLVLLFNRWYMHEDAQASRFPWQFCGFVFAMLGVVLSDNLFLSFCCWELVGLGSYLLIGFWFDKPAASEDPEYQANKGRGARGVLEHGLSPSHAQLKAVVTNRIGDAGFLLGIGVFLVLAIASGRGTDALSWSNLQEVVQDPVLASVSCLGLSGHALLVLAALGVFAGAVGKSAQFPLHVWLPDAMQGPTTASSIIHAATMVAAGVFLVARCYPMFPPEALAVVGWTGGITCLFAATIACVQWDLKAVLAYSTVSQLGLMFAGLGAGEAAGGRVAGLSHLFTHAMFKCLLFLCAGAVIHACGGHQDLQRMGGLRRRMPVVAWTSLAAVLAIAGAPLFSGFFSKDAVLAACLSAATEQGGLAWGPFALACGGSLLTSAYMLRWWFSLFSGEERDASVTHHAHDPAGLARWVLLLLAPFTLALPWTAGSWLEHTLGGPHGEVPHAANASHTTGMIVALILLALGAAFAVVVFGRGRRELAAGLARRFAGLHRCCAELWGIDRLWHRWFVRGIGQHGASTAARLDLGSPQRLAALEVGKPGPEDFESLDGLVDGVGRACASIGRGGAWFHGGRLGTYLAVAIAIGAFGLWWGLQR